MRQLPHEQTPPPELLSYNLGGTNHTFFASPEICARCHGEAFEAEGVQSAYEATSDRLQGMIEDAMLILISDQIAAGNTIDLNGEAAITDAADIDDLVFGETHGRQSITVTFDNGMTFGPFRINDVTLLDGGTELGILYDFADERLIKAGWNWNLAHNDGSRACITRRSCSTCSTPRSTSCW